MVRTTLTEATLENFLVVLGGKTSTTTGDLRSSVASTSGYTRTLDLNGGALGYSPVERSILIVGPGPEQLLENGGLNGGTAVERVYVGYRALSMETVSVGVKRNEATVFPVTFRLLPSNVEKSRDQNAIYGKIIDRVYTA